MKLKLLSLYLLLNSMSCSALSTLVYFASAVKGKNEVAASALFNALDGKFKEQALKDFKKSFDGREPVQQASGLSLEDRQKLIANASKELKDLLDKKDLSKDSDLTEVLQFIAGPQGSGGKLAKQIGKSQTQSFANTLVDSAK